MDERGREELPFDEPFLVEQRVERGLDGRVIHPQPALDVLGPEGTVGPRVAGDEVSQRVGRRSGPSEQVSRHATS